MSGTTKEEELDSLKRFAARTLADCGLLQRLAKTHRLTTSLVQHVLRYHTVGSKTDQMWRYLHAKEYLREIKIRGKSFYLLSPEGTMLANTVTATFAAPQAKTILEQHHVECDMNVYRGMISVTVDPLTATSTQLTTSRELEMKSRRNQRKVAVANHVLIEKVFGGALPSEISTWAFERGYANRKRMSSTRAEVRRLGYMNKVRPTEGAPFRWLVTESGKEWLPDTIEPNITRHEIETKIRESGFRPIEGTYDLEKASQKTPETSYTTEQLLQAHVDFAFLEDFLGSAIPSRLVAALFERAFPGYKEGSPHAIRIKNTYQTISCDRKGSNATWILTKKGRRLVENETQLPTLDAESVIDLIEKADFVFHQGNLVKAFKQTYKRTFVAPQRERLRALRADHLLCEQILQGPLPKELTKALLSHHDVNPDYHTALLDSEKSRNYLSENNTEEHGIVFNVTKFGKEDLEIHDTAPSLSETIARALIVRSGILLDTWNRSITFTQDTETPLSKLDREIAEIDKEISVLMMKKTALIRQKNLLCKSES